MANYFTLITTAGLAKITTAQLTNSKVEITEVVVGDGNGSAYTPTGTESQLKRVVWRGGVTSVDVDSQNPNWIVAEAVIPATVGGFTIREVGLYDVDGTLIAIGNYPDTYKPVLADGSTMDLSLRTIIEVSNASSVTLRIDPNVIVASRKYVDDKFDTLELRVLNIAYEVSPSDSQAEINRILSEYSYVKFSAGDYPINVDVDGVGYRFSSNQKVELHPNATFTVQATSRPSYKVFSLDNLSNVEISGRALIVGDRYIHAGTAGEFGLGVSLFDSANITIRGLRASKCWGDGFYLGASINGFNRNITLDNIEAFDNRRQGLSVISAVGLQVINQSRFTKSDGTEPQAGIDLEPNYDTQRMEKVVFRDVYTADNGLRGFAINLIRLSYIDVLIENHRSENETAPFAIQGSDKKQDGQITVIRPVYTNSKGAGILISNKSYLNARLVIEEPIFVECNTLAGASPSYHSAVQIVRESTASYNEKLGGVRVVRPRVIGTTYRPYKIFGCNDQKGVGARDIQVIDPVQNDCVQPYPYISRCENTIYTDANEVSVVSLTGNRGISQTDVPAKLVKVLGSGTNSQITFSELLPAGHIFEFYNKATAMIVLTGISIEGLTTTGQALNIGQGARVKIKKIGATEYELISISGTTTVI